MLRGIHPLSLADSNISTANFGTTDATKVTSITAPRLQVLNGASISADAYGTGDASGVVINAPESIRVGGVDNIPRSQPGRITSGARQSSFSFDENIFSFNGDSISNEMIFSQEEITGNGGNIVINTPRLELFDGGQVTATNNEIGDAGSIKIQMETLSLIDRSKIAAETQAGAGGNIRLLATDSILLRNGSQISASSGGEQIGGNITIQTSQLVAVPQENSDISANSKGAQGGQITVNAASILGLNEQAKLTPRSDITALSESGAQLSGTIELTQPTTSPVSGLAVLPSSLPNQEQAPIVDACTDADAQLSRSGRGGLPLGPNNLLHDTLLVDGENDPINQAIALRNQGAYGKALTILSKETERFNRDANAHLKSLDQMADLERQATALRQLGITHKLLEQHPEGQAALNQSLAIAQQLNNSEQISATLLSLGNFGRAENKITQARLHYQQALAENPGHTLKHQILANQLALEVATGNNDVAKRIAKDLLNELAGDISNPLHLRTRLNVAATLLKYQQLDVVPDFLTFLYQDLEGARAANDPTAIAYALGHLGQDYEQTGQWEKARQFSEAALNHAQSQQDVFQEYQWAWQLGRIAGARWKASGDENWRSQSKAAYQIALQALQQLRGDLATVSPALQFSFRNRVEPVYREYVNLLLASNHSQAQPSTANLSQALNTIEALRVAELDNFFQDSCLKTAPQAIQGLDPTAAVIYPIILDDRVEVIISHQGKLQQHSIPISPQELEATVRRFRQGLVTRSRRNYRQPGQQLYDWLIRPLLADLKIAEVETLVFVPDGPLANVPMAALFDGEQFLLEQFKVAIAPSLQLLPAKQTSAIPTHSLVAGITQETQYFAPLPYVEREVEQVQSRFPGERLLNESFTREALSQSLVDSQPPIVHIATHGQFSSKASETFILAWDEQISIEQLRELLQSRDRQALSPTELLVLSACETAAGDEFAALGLAGMAVRAGARSTLASLWAVNDQSTSALMEAFYQQLSQPGATKSGALRDAQLAMLNDPMHQHPYYWSAFVLMGSWQ